MDELIVLFVNHKIAIILALLMAEQIAYIVPVKSIYLTGVVVGKYKIDKIPYHIDIKRIKGLNIKFEGDRVYIRNYFLPDYIPGIFPLLFVGFIKNEDRATFYIKTGPITFFTAVYFMIYQIYSYGFKGFIGVLLCAFFLVGFYLYLYYSVILLFKQMPE